MNLVYKMHSGLAQMRLANFMAEKLSPKPKEKLLQIGCDKDYQTCFLAKEYDLNIIAVDSYIDPESQSSLIDILCDNARLLGVEDNILGIEACITKSILKPDSFDYAYSVTALDLMRSEKGYEEYIKALNEIYRLLKKDGLFFYGGPVRLDASEQNNIAEYLKILCSINIL